MLIVVNRSGFFVRKRLLGAASLPVLHRKSLHGYIWLCFGESPDRASRNSKSQIPSFPNSSESLNQENRKSGKWERGLPAFLSAAGQTRRGELSLFNLSSGGGETDDFLFAAADYVCRRHESDFHVFFGAGYQVAAAIQVELVFDVLAMALDGFNAQVERTRDLSVAEA